MKTLKPILTLLTFALLIISCNSDDDLTEPVTYNKGNTEENPLDAYMAYSGFSGTTTNVVNSGLYEFGFGFKPTVTGEVNSLLVKLPVSNSALRVILWDAETKTVIKTETINVPAANVTTEQVISPIKFIKDKEYFISISSDDWFFRKRVNSLAAPYPILAGKIIITKFAYGPGTPGKALFPTTEVNNYYWGDISFKFQQTE